MSRCRSVWDEKDHINNQEPENASLCGEKHRMIGGMTHFSVIELTI
ncbi:hypothetical protein KNP414_06338 [Paenibacillus mucilaginosus KNP414]|uniref:Uncharacterized protein n=1 Tax=Paenibacillus mucilaginosus (strain KNP414) TaxID=1036673 RepID=F8FLU3_PAEMK|nr:hypothetical protein KNP414_06338 [Paenibacillus mucilaginosus KNP414]